MNEYKEPSSKSSILIDFLTNSKIPYIVLFIQDPAYIYSSNKNEINELKKEIENLKNQINDFNEREKKIQ